MPIYFRLGSNALSDEELDGLSRDFVKDATGEGIAIRPSPEAAGEHAGTRGDPITLGALALAAVTSGSVVALFNLLKSYVDRSEELNVEFTRKSGTPVKLSMKNVGLDKFKEVIQQFEKEDV
ncbi:MAG: hypothetical protein QOF14_1470 [Hyphomicrobiales bacterium]|jgi:hypothetical protein|nr:hypothetical protein [Hyphomicrobiales bacterium]